MFHPIKYLFVLVVLSLSCEIAAQLTPYRWRDELDAMQRIDLLPEYRTNSIVEQVSGYDRAGGNDDGFSGRYSYIRIENGRLVIADLQGPGVINRIWTATPTTDSLFFYFDGESVPRIRIQFNELFSNTVFPFQSPICGSAIGGHYSYMPIPYKKSCKIVFAGAKMQFIQIQYRNLPGKDVETYTGNFNAEDRSLLNQVKVIWSNVSPNVNKFTSHLSAGIGTESESFTINPGEEYTFFETHTPGRIVGIEMNAGNGFEGLNKDVLLSAVWDDEAIEAIYAPIADFFGYAYGKASMRGLLVGRYNVNNYCFFPMPFDRNAKLKLIYKRRKNATQNPITVDVKVHYNNNARVSAKEGKFYTSWRREINPPLGKHYEFLAKNGKGHYVGTMHLAQGLRPGITLFFEGDDSTYVDGSMRIHGTGTEDYYNGGWYNELGRWDRAYSLAIHGSLDYNASLFRTGGYRFFIHDKMSFESEIYHGVEHGPQGNEFPVDYTSIAYFYSSTPLLKRMEPTELLREVFIPSEPFLKPDFNDLNPDIRPQHGDIAIGDINDDGSLDIVAVGQQRDTPFGVQGGIFTNDGTGNFIRKSNSPFLHGFMASIDFGDIDGDGDLDMLYTASNNAATVFQNGVVVNDGNGNFTFGNKQRYPTPPANNRGGFFADFNNDGLLDYFMVGSGANSYAAVYFQHSNTTFVEAKESFAPYHFIDPITLPIDYNNDGFTDIFIMGWLDAPVGIFQKGSFTALFQNNGSGDFECVSMPGVKMKSFGSADWGDMDGDGWFDFILHGEGKSSVELNDWLTRIYTFDGNQFTSILEYERARQFSMGGATVLQDVDNDGDLDVLFGGWADQLIPSPRQKTFVYLNNDDDYRLQYEDLNEHYFLSNQYLPGMSEQDFELADLSGDNKVDFVNMGFAENYKDNPVRLNRPILGWSSSPHESSFRVQPFERLLAPHNLTASEFSTANGQRIVLSWSEPINNVGRKNTTYNLALKNLNTGKWAYNPMAIVGGERDGWRKTNRMGNLYLNKRVELNLPAGDYEWSVQAIDAARFGGSFAPFQTLSVTTGLENSDENDFLPNIRTLQNELIVQATEVNETLELKIYGLVGTQILHTSFIETYRTSLSSGVYVVEIGAHDKKYRRTIIIK